MMKSQMDKLSITDRKMQQSLRTGHHATVYEVRRDPELKNKDVIRDKTKPVFPFISGSQYKGEWLGDVKSGFGVQVNPDNTKYEGEWSNNQYNGRGTLWMKKAKTYVRVYVGHWVNGNMEGDGIRYYDKYETYKGGWEKGQRCGKGKYEYSNGDQYVGEWHNDMRNGLGTLNCTNGNIFEGMWVDNLKEGPGLYYYASTRKVYEGEWLEDQPRCGEFRSPSQSEEIRFVRPLPKGMFYNDFGLPELSLANPQHVLSSAVGKVRREALGEDMPSPDSLDQEVLDRMRECFDSLIVQGTQSISIHDLAKVLSELHFIVDPRDVQDIVQQLEEKESYELTFGDVTDIAVFIQSNMALSPSVTRNGGGSRK